MQLSGHTAARFPEHNRTLVIMAKAPRAGTVKTRLAQHLPSSAVTALYRCLLEDTLEMAQSLDGVELAVMCPESDREELTRIVDDRVQVVAQKGKGLAAGLTSVFAHFTTAARQRVIAFNSDSPHLSPSVLHNAFEILAGCDVVVGPTHDGGYYLIGAKAAHPALFEGDGMGTRTALEGLLARTQALQLRTRFTESFYDIDVADDLVRLARELQLAPARAPRTAAWLSDWAEAISQLRQGAGEL